MEAEDVLIGTGLWLARKTGWFTRRGAGLAPPFELADSKDRLSHFLLASFGRDMAIRAANPPARPTLLTRLFSKQPLPLVAVLPSNDGSHVYLPPQLVAAQADDALRIWRVMALQQGARIMRGSTRAAWTLPEPQRAFMLLNEAVNIDALLLSMFPGLKPDLQAVRQSVLDSDVKRAASSLPAFYQRILCSPVGQIVAPCAEASCAEDSVHLAREWVADDAQAALRGDPFLGQILALAPAAGTAQRVLEAGKPDAPVPRKVTMERRPEVREAEDDEDDGQAGPLMIQSSDPIEHVEDPSGMQRPVDKDADANADELADSLSELKQARLVSTPDPAAELFLTEAADLPRAHGGASTVTEACIRYPEWDYRQTAHIADKACVWLTPLAEFNEAWLNHSQQRQRPLIELVKKQFAALKPRRVLHKRLLDGEQLDIDACVEAVTESRHQRGDERRVYAHWRPEQRDTAISIVLDASASTDAWLYANTRIIDVEKDALLVLCHALDELGCPFAMHAFSGNSPSRVEIYPLKPFSRPLDAQTFLNISALEPQRYTRLGAAIRHASAELALQPARHRLLLVLTDGKPNDCDEYEGRYGVEDTRMAVTEARQLGLTPFCLTVDRSAPAYLPRLFGAYRYALLQRAEGLPRAIADLIRRLIAG